MIPNYSYFPRTLQERAAWFQNFSNQFSLVAVSLGFTAAQATAVANDNSEFAFCASTTVEIEAFVKAFRQYRKTLTEGNIGDPTPAYPANPTATGGGVATGLFERLDDLVKRIRVAPAYTPEIGALLGIIPQGTTRPAPADMRPTLKIVSLPGSVVQVGFVRGASDGIKLEMKLDNSETWSDEGKFFSSPVELNVPQNPQSLPRAVEVRARYVQKKTPSSANCPCPSPPPPSPPARFSHTTKRNGRESVVDSRPFVCGKGLKPDL